MEELDVIILGSGAAGYTAAIYAARYNLKTVVIGKEPGGVASEAAEIENYPGFLKINGMDLMEKFKEQVESLGVKIYTYAEIESVNKNNGSFTVKLSTGDELSGRALIVALGSKRRKLGIPGEKELAGRGVSYCATCDAAFFRDKTVAVIGGNDSAAKAALLLAEGSKKVYIVYRRGKIRAEPILVDRCESNEKIEFIYNAVPVEIKGDNVVKSLVIEQDGEKKEIEVDGIFVEIGSEPEDNITAMLGLEKDEAGYTEVNADMSTNVPGVFAAGDITTGSNKFRQLTTSVAEGSIAAESVYKYINKIKNEKNKSE
ncbi:MAG: thioredoxin-disulfide reductase [Candidatus Micrarchaeota archaeon]|nr:thioredoxin-disulfide reductase [Candidatus Micrarchaeota archaeon]